MITEEQIMEYVRQCKTRSEFYMNYPVYYAARKLGIHKKISALLPGRFPPLKERFWAKVNKTTTCWLWTGHLDRHGYGSIWFKPKTVGAHRMSMILAGYDIPKDKVVDHICKNPKCVNPAHLRIVTERVNLIENSVSPVALNAKKTHCKRGHSFNATNTLVTTQGRQCKKCNQIRYEKKEGYGKWR